MIIKYSVIFILIFIWILINWLNLIQLEYLPNFIEVIEQIIIFFSCDDIINLWSTFYRMIIGFVLSAILAIPFGLIIGLNKKIYIASEILIDFFRSIPATAVFPLFLLFLGSGDASKIAIAVFISFWVVLLNTIRSVWNIPEQRIKVAKIFKATQWQIIKNVIIPNCLPQIFIGLKISISLSLIVIVVTEMFIGTKYGLGQLIYESYISFNTVDLYAYLIIIGLLGYIVNKSASKLEAKLIHWSDK